VWTRAVVKEGSKGPVACDFAFLRVTEAREGLPGPEVWLVIRRNVDDPSEVWGSIEPRQEYISNSRFGNSSLGASA